MSNTRRATAPSPLGSTGELLPSGQYVYDPRGIVTPEPAVPAPRLRALEGARIAVLDNSKWNASRLLRQTVRLLQERYAIGEVTHYTKDSFSRRAPDSLVEEIATQTDAVLTAIGD